MGVAFLQAGRLHGTIKPARGPFCRFERLHGIIKFGGWTSTEKVLMVVCTFTIRRMATRQGCKGSAKEHIETLIGFSMFASCLFERMALARTEDMYFPTYSRRRKTGQWTGIRHCLARHSRHSRPCARGSKPRGAPPLRRVVRHVLGPVVPPALYGSVLAAGLWGASACRCSCRP